MSRKKNKKAPLFHNRRENIPTVGKKGPPLTRQQLIDQLSANLFLSVWQNDGCFDDIVDRIENDKHIPAQMKLDVFNKVIASVNGFVERFGEHDKNLTREEVEEWLKTN